MTRDRLPGWLGRQLLHGAVVEVGLQWDAAALVRGPDYSVMSCDENLEAVDWSLRIAAVMRGRLPRGTSGAAVDSHWLKLAHQVAAWAIVRRRVRDREDGLDGDPPDRADVDREPAPRGPRPGGGSVSIQVVERKGGRRVPR